MSPSLDYITMKLELTAVELMRLSYMISLAKENTSQDDIKETAKKIEDLIIEQLDTLFSK
jgi:hypothetical protein